MFRVTDRPEVHSSGYHIKFDLKSGPTGYILPHWVEGHMGCGGRVSRYFYAPRIEFGVSTIWPVSL